MRSIRNLYYDYFDTLWFTLALMVCVPLSFYLSRFIPAELFETTISPMLHFSILFLTILSAIQVRWHIDGIPARRVWQRVLIVWAFLELLLFALEYIFDLHIIIHDVQTLTSEDLVVRDVFALLLLAYPSEVLYPRWLNARRSTLIILPAIVIHTIAYYLAIDLRWLLIVYPVVITMILFVQVHRYQKRCEENYSSLENTGVRWMRNYLICVTVIGLSYFYICFTNHPTRLFTQQVLILFLFAYNTTQIISRKRPWQEVPAEDEPSDEPQLPDDSAQNGATDSPFPPEYRETLEAWMRDKKPYLDKDFRLADMMQVLPVNRSYLSRYINTTYKCNFCQFVTNYRIEEAKRLLREHPEMKLREVAESTGFASAAVFSRTFAKETESSPTDWLRLQNVDNS